MDIGNINKIVHTIDDRGINFLLQSSLFKSILFSKVSPKNTGYDIKLVKISLLPLLQFFNGFNSDETVQMPFKLQRIDQSRYYSAAVAAFC